MRKNKKKNYIGLGLLFLIGLSILLYPMISDAWNKHRDNILISKYSSSVSSDENSKKIDSMWKAAEKYNEQIKQESVPDAFSVRDGEKDSTYESLLNLNGDGMMGYVEIPVIDVKIPIYHYTTDESLEKGAGHLFGSSLPVGGESTHAILSAHRGLPSAKLFTDLNLVKEGDVFYLHILNQTLAYEVDQIQTVLPDQTESLAITEGKDYVTLVTCAGTQNNCRSCERSAKIREESQRSYQSVSSDDPSLCCNRNCDCSCSCNSNQFCSEQKTTQEIIYGKKEKEEKRKCCP